MTHARRISAFVLFLLIALVPAAQAEKFQEIGDFVVHYNALGTDFLAPETARAYDIQRSANRAMVTFSVLKRTAGVPNQPVKAQISVRAVNLNQQVKPLNVREIVDQDSIYYIADFRIVDGETVDFTVEVVPEGGPRGTLSFRQQFFVN